MSTTSSAAEVMASMAYTTPPRPSKTKALMDRAMDSENPKGIRDKATEHRLANAQIKNKQDLARSASVAFATGMDVIRDEQSPFREIDMDSDIDLSDDESKYENIMEVCCPHCEMRFEVEEQHF